VPAPPLEAAPAPVPENADATREARELFLAGAEHFEARRFREAIRAFTAAAQRVPSADLWYNVARAHEELSEYEEAIEHYQRYLRDRVDPPDREQVTAHLALLRERADAARAARRSSPTEGTLRLNVDRDAARVQLDGQDAGASPWEGPRELSAGRHQLAIEREGFVPFRAAVTLEPGMTTAAYAQLAPETRFRVLQSDRVFTWVAWALGAVSLGTSIGLGVEASSRTANLPDAREWAAVSDAFLGGAIGLGVVGLVLWFVEGRNVGTERLEPEPAGTTTGVRGAR
jgi:tetratricopeptide (TPR) repeat protein